MNILDELTQFTDEDKETVEETPPTYGDEFSAPPKKSKLEQILDTTLQGIAGSTGNTFSIPLGTGDPIKTFEERGAATAERRKKLVQEAGGELDLTSSEAADAIPMSAQMKSAFGLKREEVEEAYKLGLSKMPNNEERGIKFVYDEDANPLFGETGMLISVQRDDGSYTPFSTAKFGIADYTQTFAPFIASELALDTAVVTTALATSAAVSRVGLPGKIAAPFVLGYTLYAGGVQAEKFRNEISEALRLKEEETETFFETLGELAQSTIQPLPFVGEELTQEEIMSGRIEALFGTLPVSKKAITYVSRQLSRKLHDQFAKPSLAASKETSIYESAVKAGDFAKNFKLGKLLPTQVTSNKILQRFASLAEQTTNVIPFRFRAQNRKFIKFITELRDKGITDDAGDFIPPMGGGDLAKFQEGFATFEKSVRDLDYDKLGDAQAEMMLLYGHLRNLQHRLMYREVTNTIGSRALDLTNVKSFIRKTKKTIVPVTSKELKQEKTIKIIGEESTVEWANGQLDMIEEQLLKLGKGNQLNKEQIRAAKDDFIKNMQNNVDTVSMVKTPAQIIFEYTQQLSNIDKRVRGSFAGKPMPVPVQNQLDYIRDLRKELLTSYKNPILRKNDKFKEDGTALYKEIDQKLKQANEFYAETKVTTRNELLQQVAVADELGRETKPIIAKILGTKLGAVEPSEVPTKTLKTMNKLEEYIRVTLKNLQSTEPKVVFGKTEVTDFGTETERALGLREPTSKLLDTKGEKLKPEQYLGRTQIQLAFASLLGNKLKDMAATNLAEGSTNPKVLVDYLNSFSGAEKRILGLDEINEKLLVKEAITLSKIQARLTGDVLQMEKTTPFGAAIDDLFKDPAQIESNTKSILDIIYKSDGISTMRTGKPGPQLLNARRGVFDHIFSETSGVLKKVTQNSAYGEVGDFTVDPKILVDKIMLIEKNPSLKKLMGEKNLEMLKGIANYSQVIQSTGTDAGSALSGAQLIANLYTLDPAKFIFTLGRLSAQKRMGRLLSNPKLADLMMRRIKQAEVGDDGIIREMLQADGYLGTVLATFYLENDIGLPGQRDLSDQSKDLFGPGTNILDELTAGLGD